VPKGDIRLLWNLLGVDFTADYVVYQDYNPLTKLPDLPEEFVFVDRACGYKEPFNEKYPLSASLQHVLFPFPGAVSALNASALDFVPLVRTGERSGVVHYRDMLEMSFMGPGRLNPDRRRNPRGVSYVLAAEIRGKVPASQPMADEGKKDEKGAAKSAPAKGEAAKADAADVHVILVSDIDVLHPEFFRIREQGENPEGGVRLDFDNVTFVLNVLDYLAGDERFIGVRSRRPQHRTLATIERVTEGARKEAEEARRKADEEEDRIAAEEQKKFDKQMEDLRERLKKEEVPALEIAQRVEMALTAGRQRIDAEKERLKRQRDAETNRVDTELALKIRSVQDRYKMWAVILPPIPPLVVAIGVFITRRAREREGVARSRLRS